MKVIIVFAAFAAVAYAFCHNDADCAGESCGGHAVPVCDMNIHRCVCHIPYKRAHIPCAIDADCAAWDHNCHNLDPVCVDHNGEMRCECPN